MRTFTAWEPLQDPNFESLLDGFRRFNAQHGLTEHDVRDCFGADRMELAEADAMAVAEKVRAST